MTEKTKVERRALVRGITAVSAAALPSTLLPNSAVAQAVNPISSAASDRFEGAEIKVGDNTIFIRRYGNGSPLLMVHGFPRSSLMWRFVAPQLANNHRGFRDDRGGHGLHNRCHSRLRQEWPNSGAFGTPRWLRLNPTRDHLLGLRRPAKFRSLCGDDLLGYFAVSLPSQGGCKTDTNRAEIAGEASSRVS